MFSSQWKRRVRKLVLGLFLLYVLFNIFKGIAKAHPIMSRSGLEQKLKPTVFPKFMEKKLLEKE